MRQVKLYEIAELERSKKGKIYPKGSILFGISASKSSDIFYLKSDGEVGEKFCVAKINENYNSYYIFNAILRIYSDWFEKHKENINLPFEELRKLKILIDESKEKQNKIAMKLLKLEMLIEKEEKIIDITTRIKKTMLSEMFV